MNVNDNIIKILPINKYINKQIKQYIFNNYKDLKWIDNVKLVEKLYILLQSKTMTKKVYFNMMKIVSEYTQTFDNIELVNFIKNEVKKCQTNSWNKYIKKHLMYFFVTTINDPQSKNRIICKIGYTYDLIERIKSLQNEYKSKFYLLNLKIIDSMQDEKKFHTYLKTKFPFLPLEYKIGNTYKDETYVFDIALYNEFNTYKGKEFDKEDILLEKEAEETINNYFNNIYERFEFELVQKIKCIINFVSIQNEYQQHTAIGINKLYYEYLTIKEHNKFQLDTLKEQHTFELELLREKNRHLEKIKALELCNDDSISL
jgi:hypothetical protein